MRQTDYQRIYNIGCKNLAITKWGATWIVLDKDTWAQIGHPEKTKAAAIAQAYERYKSTYASTIMRRHGNE